MTDKPRWTLRSPEADDIAFICNSFLKSYRSASSVSGVPNTLYYPAMHAIVTHLLTKSNVVIACDPSESTVIFGYAIGEVVKDDLILHWVYTKHALRNFGIAKALETELLKLPHKAVQYSCRTPAIFSVIKNRPKYVFNPFALWVK